MSSSKHLSFFLQLLKESRHGYGYSTLVFEYEPILKKLELGKSHDLTGKTQIIDLYPTNGAWSFHLNQLVNPKTHLFMEPHIGFRKDLHKMIEYSQKPDNFIVTENDPFLWESFSELVGDGKLIQPTVHSRDHIHPELILTANLAYPRGEVLLFQWMQCILNNNWAFKYGNVRMLVWCHQQTAAKLIPKPSEKHRAKSALVAELSSETNLIATTKPQKLRFTDEYLQTHNPYIIEPLLLGRTHKLDDLCLLDIKPKPVPVANIEEWDYVTKQLFIVSASPLSVAANNLGSGAVEWFKARVSPELWQKTPLQMTMEDFIELADIFYRWPFKPDIYEEMMIPSEE